MKIISSTLAALSISLISSPSMAVFDFNTGAINLTETNGNSPEHARYIETSSGTLVLASRLSANDYRFINSRLRLKDPNITTLAAKMYLQDISIGNANTQTALLGITGIYYNVNATTLGNGDGDVFVRLAFGDKGNGLEVWYEFLQLDSSSPTGATFIQRGDLITSGLSTLTQYDASVQYDGNNQFTFVFDGVSMMVNGPTRGGSADFTQRRLDTGLGTGSDLSTADLDDTTSDDGSTVEILGVFDDVYVDGVLFEDFSGSALDTAKWNGNDLTQYSRYVENQKLNLVSIATDSNRVRTNFYSEQNTDYFEAKLTLSSDSTQGDASARNEVRMDGFWYNDTSASGNDRTGDVWGGYKIRRNEDGSIRCDYYLERSDDATHSTATQYFYLGTPCAIDTEYALKIELEGSQLIYTRDGVEDYRYDIATPIHPVNGGFSKYVQARQRDGIGKTVAIVDDINFDKPQATTTATTTPSTTTPADSTNSSSSGSSGGLGWLFISTLLALFSSRRFLRQ